MARELEEAEQNLSNARAGWVHRRDAALALGRWAAIALDALKRHINDPDPDVRRAVAETLAKIHLPAVPASDGSYPLETLARACEKPGKREVQSDGSDFMVQVKLPEGRQQQVRLSPAANRDGHPLIHVSTRCGEASEKAKNWALRYNAKLVHCAFAVQAGDEREELVLMENIPFRHATPEAVKAAVKEIAFYGDWIEQRLHGGDSL